MVSRLPEALASSILHDIERPSSPVAQVLRSAVPPAGEPAARPAGAAGAGGAEAELRDLIREGCEVLALLPEGLAAGLVDGLERAVAESPVCAVIRRAATPVAPAPAPRPGGDAAADGAGGVIRPFAEAEAVPAAGRPRQLPSVVVADGYDAGAGRREGPARRASDAYEVEREQELQTMALRLETAYEALEQQRRAHDAAMLQARPAGAAGLGP